MKYKKISFQNIGPIEKGEITRKKINVFFGHNNSGKSIASRIIYGVYQADAHKSAMQRFLLKKTPAYKNSLFADLLLHSAGIPRWEITSSGKNTSKLEIEQKGKSKKITVNFKKPKKNDMFYSSSRRFARMFEIIKDSVYIPAGRTGTIQSFTNILQIRNKLLRDMLGTLRGYRFFKHDDMSAKELKIFTRSLNELPQHLEQFHDLILESISEGLQPEVQKLFGKLFSGSLKINSRGVSEIRYTDPTGFTTKIESVGSGIVSSFPIIAGIYYVNKDGTLIIEEPEVHLEPARQIKLIEELILISKEKNLDLVFTTHSDYILKKFLALVSSKKIKHSDLGLYYFKRKSKKLTHIEELVVDKTGEVEQEMFNDAINTLVEDFSQ